MWRSRAPLPSLPGCGYQYQQLPVSPWRRGSCLEQDTVDTRSLWRVGGLHFPTHRACARGGDGQSVTPHIEHRLVEGVGTLSYHTSGRHCGAFEQVRSHPGWPSPGDRVESAISISIWPWSAPPSRGAAQSRFFSFFILFRY